MSVSFEENFFRLINLKKDAEKFHQTYSKVLKKTVRMINNSIIGLYKYPSHKKSGGKKYSIKEHLFRIAEYSSEIL